VKSEEPKAKKTVKRHTKSKAKRQQSESKPRVGAAQKRVKREATPKKSKSRAKSAKSTKSQVAKSTKSAKKSA
jgi:hypothetical protein